MAATGFTPIQLYYSTTASAAPSSGNLANGELAINITDGKLFYKDNGGTVRVLAGTSGTGVVAGSNTQVQFNNNGVFGASSGLTWDGTNLTASQLRSSGLTSGRVTYAGASGLLVDSANMTFNGTRLTVADLADSGLTSGRVTYATTGGNLTDSANLTFDGTNLTLGGGTANGVAYLNGSKVLTTGSALVFDGTNLGLAVPPSAWSGGKAVDVGAHAGFAGYSVQAIVATNAYWNGTAWTYKTTNAASYYQQNGNSHAWFTAPSGTAGNAISFTQAMTLDASGNLAIGATNAAQALHVARGSGVSSFSTFRANGSTSGALYGQDSSNNAYCWNESNAVLLFGTNNTERARIDSSGNLLVGTTDTGAGTGPGFKFKPAGNGANAPLFNIVTANSANTSSSIQLYSTGVGAYRFYVGDGGTVYATSTSISAISDATLKENVRDLETGLAEVMSLRPRRFDWKSGDAKNVAGFVAQEVEQVLPELVTDYQYSKGVTKKSLKMGDILPTLVKAVQEQQAIIEQLKADVAALKAKA